MSKFLEKLPKIMLWGLLAISAVICLLFWVGGGTDVEINGNMWNEPRFTDTLLNWAYVLIGLTGLIWVYSLVRFDQTVLVKKKKDDLTILDILVVSLIVFGVAWLCGSADYINIIGYDGTQNVGTWAKFTDACIISCYILLAIACISVVVSLFFKKIK